MAWGGAPHRGRKFDMEEMRLSLDGTWKLMWLSNREVEERGISVRTFAELIGSGGPVVDGTVPGNFELDLQRAGLIEDPFFGENAARMAKYETFHLWYGRQFRYSGGTDRVSLDFQGIDTIAEVYLNGSLIGRTENMLIPHRIGAEGLREGDNDLVVHLLPAVVWARQLPSAPGDHALFYNYAGLRVRKAAHMYGWDIMPRLVSGGIWRSAALVREKENRIEETYLYPLELQGEGRRSEVCLYYRLGLREDEISRYMIAVEGSCGESRFSARSRLWFSSGHLRFFIDDSRLWWMADRGAPSLYQVKVRLLLDGEEADRTEFEFGLRTVELVRTPVTDSGGKGKFQILLNGERVFIKGTNWVPVDAFHSRDRERIPQILRLASEIGCNTLRCWGGNVYEDHDFFQYCDRNGLLVWQDFAMGCGIYPQDDAFCGQIAQEVEAVVKRLRQHPSLGIWSGDNECDMAYAGAWSGIRRDPNENRITRRVIPEILSREDPFRPYLPSSPYVSPEAYGEGLAYLPEDHLWGPRDSFKSSYYQGSLAHFASEMGYHGCTAPASMARFLSPEKLWPAWNREWMIHCAPPEAEDGPYSYRRELMFRQVRELFGEAPETLEEFALSSQISQAEAMKFFVELFRSMKWRRSGIIWWNLMDGWPQFSDAVVDYYFQKKLAFHYIKAAQQPVCLLFSEPKDWKIGLMASNDTREPVELSYRVTDLSRGGGEVLRGSACVPADACVRIDSLPYSMGEKGIYLMEWQAGRHSGRNHYLYGNPPFRLEDYLSWMQPTGLLRADGFQIIEP